jgi:hypothetical protein
VGVELERFHGTEIMGPMAGRAGPEQKVCHV